MARHSSYSQALSPSVGELGSYWWGRASRAMYRRQSSSRSSSPSARSGSLLGTQYQKAALRAVPPSWGAFSSRITSLPSQRLNSAAGSPPPPPPTTTTSASASKVPSPAGAADSRGATSRSIFCSFPGSGRDQCEVVGVGEERPVEAAAAELLGVGVLFEPARQLGFDGADGVVVEVC